jgi:tetratricopeptide (TPR) repeat protein
VRENGAAEKKPRSGKVEPLDSVNMMKAQKLFDQALKDKADGNLVSARMNMKLAITFDPTNELYVRSFDELSKNPDAQLKGSGPMGKSRARELYDQATEAENGGDVERAIALLEQAITLSKQAPFLNRLGVILAMKKREFARAQQLVEQAIDLAPDNGAYEKNLQKILSMAATSDIRRQNEDKDQKKGLLGLLGRRK